MPDYLISKELVMAQMYCVGSSSHKQTWTTSSRETRSCEGTCRLSVCTCDT